MERELDYINLLPEEILTSKILHRLPVKSLGRCKCVSKLWNSLITDPHFIKNNLIVTSNNNNTNLILISTRPMSPNPGLLYSVHFDNNHPDSDGFASKLNFVCCDKWSKIWGSCNGLILAEDDQIWSDLFLLNPTTLEFKKLPPLLIGYQNICVFGFGYDSSCDDYAVVAISYRHISPKKDARAYVARVYVYMLKTNQWNKFGVSPYDHKLYAAGIFVGGSLHWLAKNVNDSSWLISAFNIANKEFSEVRVPTGVLDASLKLSGVLKGCLCLIILGSIKTELWVMKEYGVVKSWIKLSIDTTDIHCDMPLHLREDNLVVMGITFVLVVTKAEAAKLCQYNKATIDSQRIFGVGMFCIDSLVSPNNKDENQKKNRGRRSKTTRRMVL